MVWTRHLCRICAQIGDICYPIFDKNCGHNIEIKMKKCFSFAVCRDDYKPKEICNCCYIKLNQFYEFIELCHASNNKFETMIYSSHQGIWLEKQTNDFEDCQMSGVIVNTKTNLDSMSHVNVNVMSVGYDSALNLNHQEIHDDACLNLADPNYSAAPLNVNVNYIPAPDLNKQNLLNNQCFDPTQTVLRHSSDFYKHVDNTNYNELNYINLRIEQGVVNYSEPYDHPIEVNKQNCTENKKSLNQSEPVTDANKVKTIDKKRSKRFACQHCSKTFMRKINLNAHLAIHSKQRPYSCDVCQKSFAISRYLTCHKRVHTDLYRCKYCAKNFSVPSKLHRHLQIHMNLKPYVCPVDGCGKSFSDKCNLIGHRATHSDAKDFICDICNKGYKTNSKLKDHRKVHSSETPFKCGICNKTYKWKTNLTVHMKKHDGYKCTRCKRDCEKLSVLLKHRKICKRISRS